MKAKKEIVELLEKNAVLRERVDELEREVCCLKSSVSNLQNFTRILERDVCHFGRMAAIGEDVKDSVLKEKV